MASTYSRRRLFQVAGTTVAGATVLGTAARCGFADERNSWRNAGGGVPAGTKPIDASLPDLEAAPTTWWADLPPRKAVRGEWGLRGGVENLQLSAQPFWVNCDLVPGATYRLRAVTEGTNETGADAAVASFADSGGGEGLLAGSAGPFIQFKTANGLCRTDQLVSVKNPVRRYGLRLSNNRGPVQVKFLTIENVDPGRPTSCFLSFDVEALPTRGADNLIDRLVWGRYDGQEYGLRRICAVLEQYRIRANFMIDFASCARNGERSLREIVEYLASRNHEIHLHLHAEHLSEFNYLGTAERRFDRMSYDNDCKILEFVTGRFRKIVGRDPRVFRTGGLYINKNLVRAAATVGLPVMSNVRRDMVRDPFMSGDADDGRELFTWENGVTEIPLDFNPDPLGVGFNVFLEKFEQLRRRRASERTFNLLFHSWSLFRESSRGYFETYTPEHEKRLHEICDHVTRNGSVSGYGEYLDATHRQRPLTMIYRVVDGDPAVAGDGSGKSNLICNVCGASFARSAAETGVCPNCHCRARERQLRHVLDDYSDLFDRKTVLAYNAVAMRRWGLLPGASAVYDFSKSEGMKGTASKSVDCFVGLHLIENKNDTKLVEELAKVLKPGGVFVSTVRYLADGQQLGVANGAGHLYLGDYLRLLSGKFAVASVPGYDHVTNRTSRVFIATRLSS